ncbi:7-carboxy-7-deazaguanine synthase QueE [Desulfurivibrio alkaliphilus]|uniref:7-carboxy-7-deazaguanine synthase n=1 Tax=Desulfurivibrio alkaliphilus (strain DSM 19089 / UNIQEM U267 / AHT2) TaxID=589865 RepID=D6Z267_DESAT|nr:radical SAM protein [Desulfurivibrio alkaliphilus]ADH85642.1 Radical SAM domain protein [Desulfurivibrio alkaliphilus AHT 2]
MAKENKPGGMAAEPATPPDTLPGTLPGTLMVAEIFYSLQGESSHAGYPCIFVRLAGCNLRCVYCDARYTYEEAGTCRTIAEVMAAIAELPPVSRVEITGGEPLLQEEVYSLLNALLADQRQVLLETNGTISLARVPAAVHCIMDVKCPGSGMAEHLDRENFRRLTDRDEIKFVLSDRRDYDWARKIINEYQLADHPHLIFSPVTNRLQPSELAAWLLADALPARLQLQLHTQLWPGCLRGK